MPLPPFDCHTHHLRPNAIHNVRLGVAGPPSQVWYCAGIHPWDSGRYTVQNVQWPNHDHRWVAVGECGLDRMCPVPYERQQTVFIEQLVLSEQLSLPVFIHCVRAFHEVALLRRSESYSMPWIVHGFNKGGNALQTLLDAGLYVSFGSAILDPATPAAWALPQVPEGSFLLETDESDVSIDAIYATAAILRRCTIADIHRSIDIARRNTRLSGLASPSA